MKVIRRILNIFHRKLFKDKPKAVCYDLPFFTVYDQLEERENEARYGIEIEQWETLCRLFFNNDTLPLLSVNSIKEMLYNAPHQQECLLCLVINHGKGTHFKNGDSYYTICRLCLAYLVQSLRKPTDCSDKGYEEYQEGDNNYCLYVNCSYLAPNHEFYCVRHRYKIDDF